MPSLFGKAIIAINTSTAAKAAMCTHFQKMNMINEEQDVSERLFPTEKPVLKKSDKFGEDF
ncbi:MAG: hypothetical protein WA139_03060 [Candidatus Aenigmatarchaeota archaeon]